jgi:glycoprotein endo-alpha-1,2-mannosidase
MRRFFRAMLVAAAALRAPAKGRHRVRWSDELWRGEEAMDKRTRSLSRREFAFASAIFAAGGIRAAEPKPAEKTAPRVGVYYYPWYHRPGAGGLGEWQHVMRLHLKAPQKPHAGLYDSGDAEVIGKHIAQSVRGGIDFWAVSWWGPTQICDDNLRTRILAHPDAGKLKYALLYEATGRFGAFDKPDYRHWLDDLAYMAEHYFAKPSYLKIGGKPVLFVYLTREYFRNKGRQALDDLRAKFPHVYLAGDDVFGPGYKAEWARNFDAITAYDVYGQSTGPLGGTRKAVDYLAANYAHAKAQAASVGTAFMPTIAPGYNDTAVRKGHPGRARYFADEPDSREGDVFRAMIRRAALPHLDPRAERMLLVTSFNEWYEDSQIEATEGTASPSTADDSETGAYYTGGQRYADYGELYLDILREEAKGGVPGPGGR